MKRKLQRLKSPFTDMFKGSAMENNLPKWLNHSKSQNRTGK